MGREVSGVISVALMVIVGVAIISHLRDLGYFAGTVITDFGGIITTVDRPAPAASGH